MCSIPILRQDFRITASFILFIYILQSVSLLLAAGICEMQLIEISDIFFDTIPVIIIPMLMQMLLAYQVVRKQKDDGTMDFILATQISPLKIICTKAIFIILNTAALLAFSLLLGGLGKVYSLTGEWEWKTYFLLNVGAFALQMCVGGFCFLVSCVSKSQASYFGAAVMLPIFFYAVYIAYYLVPQLSLLQYITPFSLFRQAMYAAQSVWIYIHGGVLLLAGICFYFIGLRGFVNKIVEGR